MRRYYNAGGAGRSYSKMEVRSASAPFPSVVGFNVEFAIFDSKRSMCDTHLSPKQVRDLHTQLGVWLSSQHTPPAPPPPPPMIEGDDGI